MKLTKEQIIFIDTYLKNSGVEYLDIRGEMTDHVAAALEEQEGDFYDNFKEYMLKHKQELLTSNLKFTKLAGNRAFKILVTTSLKPLTLVVFLLVFIASNVLLHHLGEEKFSDIITTSFLVFGLGIVIYLKIFYRGLKAKYSVVTKLQAIVSTFPYVVLVILKPERIIENIEVLIGFYSLFTAFMISIFVSYKEVALTYKLRYNGNEK